MKTFLCLFLLCVPTLAEKMHVKVINHTVGGIPYAQSAPEISVENGRANSDSYSTSSIYVPPQSAQGAVTDILMTLALPDGRKVDVGCEDRFGRTNAHRRNCKNPTVDELEANFSGDKVKLTWVAGMGGKKKDSEMFTILRIFPDPTSQSTP